jgi:hypothetical protein
LKHSLDRFVEEVLDLCVFITLQLIEFGVLQYSTEEETPSNPLNTVLFVVDLTTSNFSVDMVSQLCKQTGLNGEGIV